jgi:hypothetical protein
MRPARLLAPVVTLYLVSASLLAQGGQPALAPTATAAAADACAHNWIGREPEFEEFLKAAKVTGLKDVPVGVTRPSRAYLAPGGLAESMAWKPITPGMKNGFYESYRSEIAAYELDKLVGLGMIPPTVERDVNGQTGAAVLWASPTRSFKELGGVPGQAGVAGPPGPKLAPWIRQVMRAKMFDNLIANKDPNLGNWLVDPDWHLLLIDHSRSFTTQKSMVHKMDNVDGPLWEKFKALDEASLTEAVGKWLGKGELKAILERRDAMAKDIDRLVKAKGESAILK